MVSLWDLMTLIAAVTPMSGCMEAANFGKYRMGGYAFAFTLGLILGFCNGWMVWKFRRSTFKRLLQAPWLLPYVYGAAALWIMIGSVFLAADITSALVRSLG